MADERVTVTLMQVAAYPDGSKLATGELRTYMFGRGDYDETIAALKAADFKVFDTIQDAVDRALDDEANT